MRARKRFGQHFLEDVWVRKVVAAIDPQPGDMFLEIGPGRGALTLPLAARAAGVVAIEVDRDLAARLPTVAPANVRIVLGDFLEVSLAGALPPPAEAPRIRVAGNLPYNISSPILFRLLEARAEDARLADATLMLQKEVADRLVAPVGTRDYGVLTVLIGRRARVTHLLTLPPGAFRPSPEVTSSVVRLEFLPEHEVIHAPWRFDAMVRALFTLRRKTMRNALAAYAGTPGATAAQLLSSIGIDSRSRPETLTIEEFARVAASLNRLR